MTAPRAVTNETKVAMLGAAGTLLGVILSGPLAVLVVNATHPQPAWESARVFAQHYHPVQNVPYLGGIVLVAALVALIGSLHGIARDEHKIHTRIAVMFSGVFATLVFLNYVIQATFLPELARSYDERNAPLIAAFSMVNPRSLAWGIEMWGWGFLGVATWLAAPVFHGSPLERAAALAFIANGPVSILGALWTTARPGWVLTPAGFAAFGSWNVLLALMATLAYLAFRRRRPLVWVRPSSAPMRESA